MRKITCTMQQGSEMSGLCVRQLYFYIDNGTLESRKIGKRRLLVVDSLEKFLSRDQPSPTKATRSMAFDGAPSAREGK